MSLTQNEGKSIVAERFIRTLKNKVCKHYTAVSTNVCFYLLKDIVDKYNNTYHNTIKMNPIDVKSNSYVKYNVNSNVQDDKFKKSDYVKTFLYKNIKTSKYKNIFDKGYAPNCLEEVFVISKIKILLKILMVKKLLELFMKKNFRGLIKKNLE